MICFVMITTGKICTSTWYAYYGSNWLYDVLCMCSQMNGKLVLIWITSSNSV